MSVNQAAEVGDLREQATRLGYKLSQKSREFTSDGRPAYVGYSPPNPDEP